MGLTAWGQILVMAKFSAPVETGLEDHPATHKWVTVLLPGGKVALTTHPI
jgi:hypothetical protein